MADLTNKNLGNFRIGHTLGVGGMGAVYKARDTRLDIPVAIKVMHPHFAQKLAFQQRFQQEARSAAAIEHPNIVGVRHFDQEGPHLYMVMEYIPGDNLRELLNALLNKNEWLPLSETITLVRNVCQAIGHAHKRGVIHRDIKPANIMLKPDEESRYGYRPVITDLGLAKMMGTAGITQTDEVMGTPAYMSPEQVLGPNEAIGAASDIYALGILLYELVTGQPPFRATRISEVMHYHTQEPPQLIDPQTLCSDLPDSINLIIHKALKRTPQQRHESTDEMAAALTTVLQQNLPNTRPLTAHYLAGLATLHQESIVAQRGDSLVAQFEQARPVNHTRDGIQIVTPSGDVRFMNVGAAPITVGREEDNHLVLRDDPKLSRYHAQIEYKNNRLYVTDNGSTNGVYLDEAALQPNERTAWNKDATLRIGNHYLRLIPAQISAPTPVAPRYHHHPANNADAALGVSEKRIEATAPYPPQKEAKRGLLHSIARPWLMGLLSFTLLATLGGFVFFMFFPSFDGITTSESSIAEIDASSVTSAITEQEDSKFEIIETPTSTIQVEAPIQTQISVADVIETVSPTFTLLAGVTPTPTPTPTLTLTPVPALVAKKIVNIREGPNTAHPVLDRLQQDQEAVVIGRNSDDTWWQIEMSKSDDSQKLIGWVFGDLVTLREADRVQVAKQIPTLPPPTLPPPTLPPPTLPPTSLPPTSLPPTSLPPTALPPTPLPRSIPIPTATPAIFSLGANAACVNRMIRVVPKSNWETPFALKRSSHSVFPGQRITFSFHLSDTAHAGRFGLQEITQTSPRAFLGLILLKGNNPADQGAIYVDYNLGQGDIAKPEILVPQKSQTWYRAEIQIQVDGSVTWRLYEGSNSPNPVIDFTENDSAFRERFRNGRFAFYLQAGTVSGNTIIDVSSYIEGTDPTNLVRSHCN